MMDLQLLLCSLCLVLLAPMFAWAHPAPAIPDSSPDLNMTYGNSLLEAPPLIIPGQDLAAQLSKRADGDLPAIQFSDTAKEIPRFSKILTNFIQTGSLDQDWSTPICKTITQFDPSKNGNSGIFDFNVQGTHKQGLSLVHEKRYLSIYASFTTTDAEQLRRYDLMNLCKAAIHQASQTNHELKYGFFGSKTVYSVVNSHLLFLQPTLPTNKRSSFGGPIGIINIQFGDEAKGVKLFNLNGLPV